MMTDRETIKVMIAGDMYMEPKLIEKMIRENLGEELSCRFSFTSIRFPYPEETIALHPDTVIPSGMSWTDFSATLKGDGSEEFYGDIHALEGALDDAEVLIVHGAAVTGTVLKKAGKLKLIGVLRGGPKNIDVATAHSRGVRMVNTPGKTSRAVAESMVGGLLSLTRNIARSSRSLQSDKVWSPAFFRYDECGIEIEGRTLGIIGFGHIGEKIVKILRGFDLKEILVYDPYRDTEDVRRHGCRPADFHDVLRECDIISLHARLNASSRGMIGRKELERMERHPIVLNTARGGLLDYPALIDALRNGKVSGAVLDVFGEEPFSIYEELLDMKNVVCTPHVAGGSRETVHRAARMMAEDLRRYALDEPLLHEMKVR